MSLMGYFAGARCEVRMGRGARLGTGAVLGEGRDVREAIWEDAMRAAGGGGAERYGDVAQYDAVLRAHCGGEPQLVS